MHYQELYSPYSAGRYRLSPGWVQAVGGRAPSISAAATIAVPNSPRNCPDRRRLARGVEHWNCRRRAPGARRGDPQRVAGGPPDDVDGAATGETDRRRVRGRRRAETLGTDQPARGR